MHDVVPPSESAGRSRRSTPGSSRRVQVNWKLPARLRKPVRDQLVKERRLKKQREAIIRFERKPLITSRVKKAKIKQQPKSIVGLPPYAGGYTRNMMNRRMAPVPRKQTVQPEPRRLRTQAVRAVPNKKPAALINKKAARPITASKPVRPKATVSGHNNTPARQPNIIQGERDIPFNWKDYQAKAAASKPKKISPRVPPRKEEIIQNFHEQDVFPANPQPYYYRESRPKPVRIVEERTLPVQAETERVVSMEVEEEPTLVSASQEDSVEVIRPKSRFSLPFIFNIWPKTSWVSSTKKKIRFRPKDGFLTKAKLVNIGMLIGGSLVIGSIVWNLQGVGRGLTAFYNIQDRATEAYEHLLAAQSAMAETDFDASEESFGNAEVLLRDAREEINEAFAASRHILQWIDVTGTVRSGDKILLAGEKLTQAGQHSARGLSLLLNSKVVIGEINEIEEGEVPVIKAISLAKEEIKMATAYLDEAEKALQRVDSPFFPDDIRENLEVLKQSVPKVNSLLKEFFEQSDILLDVLGAHHSRQYLLLFANNHELRPIGGFLGSIGLVNIDEGVVENIDVSSVYDSDGQIREFITPPDPLLPITDRWYMRDANWFVDYTVSAKKIAEFFEKGSGPTVDGVILMTPEVIKSLLDISGPVTLPQYDLTVSKDNFYLVTQDQVTYSYNQEENSPKQFLSDLTPVLLNKLLSDDDKSGLEILGALSQSLKQKDLLLYFKNTDLQEKLVELGLAGALPPEAQGFLMVNNANIGGHKSDQFIEQEIDYRSQIKDNNDVEVVLTIRRTHHGPSEALDYDYPEDENPAYKTNNIYQRVLVPQGAKLLDAKGYASASDIPSTINTDDDLPMAVDAEVARWQSGQTKGKGETVIGEEAGYTFFANWVVTKPGETSVTLYKYVLPGHAQRNTLLDSARRYLVYLAKQPGDMRTTVRVSVDVPSDRKIVHTVPIDGITRHADNSVVYRGSFKQDIVMGAVYAKQ